MKVKYRKVKYSMLTSFNVVERFTIIYIVRAYELVMPEPRVVVLPQGLAPLLAYTAPLPAYMSFFRC